MLWVGREASQLPYGFAQFTVTNGGLAACSLGTVSRPHFYESLSRTPAEKAAPHLCPRACPLLALVEWLCSYRQILMSAGPKLDALATSAHATLPTPLTRQLDQRHGRLQPQTQQQ